MIPELSEPGSKYSDESDGWEGLGGPIFDRVVLKEKDLNKEVSVGGSRRLYSSPKGGTGLLLAMAMSHDKYHGL